MLYSSETSNETKEEGSQDFLGDTLPWLTQSPSRSAEMQNHPLTLGYDANMQTYFNSEEGNSLKWDDLTFVEKIQDSVCEMPLFLATFIATSVNSSLMNIRNLNCKIILCLIHSSHPCSCFLLLTLSLIASSFFFHFTFHHHHHHSPSLLKLSWQGRNFVGNCINCDTDQDFCNKWWCT